MDFEAVLKVCEEIIAPDLPGCRRQVGWFAGVKRSISAEDTDSVDWFSDVCDLFFICVIC